MTAAPSLAAVIAVAGGLGCDGTFGLIHVPPGATRDSAPSDTTVGDGPVAEGLIAHYPMNAIAGGALADVAGDHDGTCTSCPLDVSTGAAGDALRFNGTTDIIDVPATPAFATVTGFTVSLWLRLETAPTTGMVLCSAGLQLGPDFLNSWQLCAEEGHVLWVGWYDAGLHHMGAFDIGEDAWHHVVLRWDGTTLTMTVDANFPGSVSETASLQFDGGPLYIGADRDTGTPAFWWDGSIDDLRIYNRALSDSEITQLPGL